MNAPDTHLKSPSLVLSVALLPGESLSGLLARAAARNVISSSRDFLAPIGLSVSRLSSIATAYHLHKNDIANFLGVDATEISHLFYRVGDDKPEPRSNITVCSMLLPVQAREAKFRRVSFQSLRNSSHHRAAWELRFLPWCPESFEILVDVCPSCGNRLGWQRFSGVHICERCLSDLRTFQGDFVPECRRQFAYSFFRLFSLDKVDRTAARAALHPDLRDLSDKDLLQLVAAAGYAFQVKPSEANNVLFSTNNSQLKSKCEAMLLGVERILDWENSIAEILAESIRNADQESGYGIRNQFGAVAKYLRPQDSAVSILLRKTILIYCRRNKIVPLCRLGLGVESAREGWTGIKTLISQLNTNNKHLKRLLDKGTVEQISCSVGARSPIFVKLVDVARLQKECADAIEIKHGEALTGLPDFVLHELIALGLLMPATADVITLRGEKEMMSVSSVNRLEINLFHCSTEKACGDEKNISLSEALKMGAGKPFFASALFSRINSGAIPLKRDGDESLCMGLRFCVKFSELKSILVSGFELTSFVKNLEKMPVYISYVSTAKYLDVEEKEIYRLTRNRLLPTRKVGRSQRIIRADLYSSTSGDLLK